VSRRGRQQPMFFRSPPPLGRARPRTCLFRTSPPQTPRCDALTDDKRAAHPLAPTTLPFGLDGPLVGQTAVVVDSTNLGICGFSGPVRCLGAEEGEGRAGCGGFAGRRPASLSRPPAAPLASGVQRCRANPTLLSWQLPCFFVAAGVKLTASAVGLTGCAPSNRKSVVCSRTKFLCGVFHTQNTAEALRLPVF
jgi:hypothetical protein